MWAWLKRRCLDHAGHKNSSIEHPTTFQAMASLLAQAKHCRTNSSDPQQYFIQHGIRRASPEGAQVASASATTLRCTSLSAAIYILKAATGQQQCICDSSQAHSQGHRFQIGWDRFVVNIQRVQEDACAFQFLNGFQKRLRLVKCD